MQIKIDYQHEHFIIIIILFKITFVKESNLYNKLKYFKQRDTYAHTLSLPTHTHTKCINVSMLTSPCQDSEFAVVFGWLWHLQTDVPLGTLGHICATLRKEEKTKGSKVLR